MELFPKCTLQLVEECKPGDLVRMTTYGDEGVLAIVSDWHNEDMIAVVALTDAGAEINWLPEKAPDRLLCYGRKYALHLNQKHQVEYRTQSLSTQSGCIVLHCNEHYLNAHFPGRFHDKSNYAGYQLNLATGEVSKIASSMSNYACYGTWQLELISTVLGSEKTLLLHEFNSKYKID